MGDDNSRFSTVLLVDSDEEDRYLLKAVLGLRGVDVIQAIDGHQAVDLAFRWRPELILIEIRPPIAEGFTAIRQIRKLASLRKVPIISFALDERTCQKDLALAAGAEAHLSKPIDFDQLDSLIDQFLPGHELELASLLLH